MEQNDKNINSKVYKYKYEEENAREIIENLCNNRLKEIYGQNIPKKVQARYENELNMIYKNNYKSLFVLNYLISKKAKEDNEYYIIRGIGSNSYIAYILGISEINPIDYGLEYEMSYGLNGEKPFEIYYFFSATYYPYIVEYIRKIISQNLGYDYNKIFYYMPSCLTESFFEKIKPKSLKELYNIYGAAKSTFDVEEGKSFEEQIIEMGDCCTRDDIYTFLLNKGIEKEIAFEITEFVRKGKANNKKYFEQWCKYKDIMKEYNVDETYFEKYKRIKYLFPKSNILNNLVYIIKHIAYMAYYPEVTEKVISKNPKIIYDKSRCN